MSLHAAIVRDVHDPMRSGRIRVECPSVYDEELSPWAMPCLSPNTYTVPMEGTPVWIMLRECNPSFPVWMGSMLFFDGKKTPEEFRDWSDGPYKEDLLDATVHAKDEYDTADHKKGEGHNHPPYYDPYLHTLSFPTGASWLVNEEPGQQSSTLLDRLGQGIEMAGDPTGPKDPHQETVTRGTKSVFNDDAFTVSQLDAGSETRTVKGFRALLRILGIGGQGLRIRTKDADNEQEIELENKNEAGDKTNKLWMSLIDKFVKLTQAIPGKIQGIEMQLEGSSYIKVFNHNSKEYLRLDDTAQKVTLYHRTTAMLEIAADGTVTVLAPAGKKVLIKGANGTGMQPAARKTDPVQVTVPANTFGTHSQTTLNGTITGGSASVEESG